MFIRLISTLILVSIAIPKAFAYEVDETLWEEMLGPDKLSIFLYPIEGKNPGELEKSMLEGGPVSVSGTKHFAKANWNIKWEWKSDNELIDYSETLLELSLKLVLPTPLDSKVAKSGEWDSFFKNTVSHEIQHLKHGAAAYDSISKLLTGLPQSISKSEANRLINAEIVKARRFDNTYDKETNHGKFEGIYLAK